MNNKEVEEHHDKTEESVNEIVKGAHLDPFRNFKNVAIGFLDITEPQYEIGEVPSGFVKKLKSLYHSGMMLGSLGFHECEFCLNQGVKELPKDARSSSIKILRDKKNKINYIFPEMIFHYIDIHKFKPSQEFIDFIMGENNGKK